jgi:hypothetical protein
VVKRLRNYFLQHFAQPAASPQHCLQVAGSLQQAPVQAAAFGFSQLPQELQVLQPVVNMSPAAKTTANISIIDFIGIGCSDFIAFWLFARIRWFAELK